MKTQGQIKRGFVVAAKLISGGAVRIAAAALALLCAGEARGQGLAPINPAFIQWQKERQQTTGNHAAPSKPAKSGTLRTASRGGNDAETPEPVFGLAPSVFDSSYLSQVNVNAQRGVGDMLPPSFDLRSKGILSPVRNQSAYGTCWAHATFSSLESGLRTFGKGSHDFSEKNLALLHGGDWSFDEGGNADLSSAYLLRWSGPVLESQDPYPSDDYYLTWFYDNHTWNEVLEKWMPLNKYTLDSILPESPSVAPAFHVQNVHWVPGRTSYLDNDEIKSAVAGRGVLYVDYFHDDKYLKSASYYNYDDRRRSNGSRATNHAVAIVGWDDDYPAGNFGRTPPGNGAFIVRNSWGTSFGEGGYFYVSYYDESFAWNTLYAFSDAESQDNYDAVYQYDPMGLVSSYGYGTTTAWGANMFTASAATQLAAVGFYALSPSTSYTIYIYTGCSAGAPTSGTLAISQSGKTDSAGFFTIPLATGVSLKSNQRFSVVVKFSTPATTYPVPVEYALAGYSSGATASSGQSFISAGGSDWADLGAAYGANICLKAYAKAEIVATPKLSSIAIIPNNDSASLAPGEKVQLTCEATYENSAKADVTALAEWSVLEGGNYATITSGGLLAARTVIVLAPQTVMVQAVYVEDGISATNRYGFSMAATRPEPPANVSASQGAESSCVRVNWTAPAGATEYAVYRATVNNAANAKYIDRVTVPKYNDTTATPGVDYWYFVKAKNSSGPSSFSEGARGWRAIAAPANVSASDGASVDFVKVTWDAVDGATCYRVFRAESFDGDSTPLTGWISATEFTDSTAEPGTVYWYSVVAATDSAGTRPSAAGIPDDGFRAVPVVPSAIAIEGDGAIPSGGAASYAAFAVYSDGSRGESPLSPAWEVSAGTVSRTGEVTAPTVSANADIVISAHTTLEGVAISGMKTVTVTASAPGAPSNFRLVSATAAGVSLAWDAVPGASRYVVSRSASGGTTDFTTAEAAFTDTSATPGVAYSYGVAAENAAGTGPQSAPVTVTIPLAAPTGVKATSDRTDGVRVTWGSVPGATHYRVARATAATGAKTELGAWTADTAYLDMPPAADTAYWYFVKAATDSFGSNPGAWSEGIEGRMKPVRTLLSLSVSGPDRVAAGGEAVYSCKASWSDGAEEAVSPAWSVSPASAGSIDANGRFGAASVSSDVGATVTATYGGKTGTASVTVLAPAAATAEITSVTAAQRWPFASLVDIDYTLATTPAGTRAAVSVSAFDEDHGAAVAATALSGDGADGPIAAGTHRLTWNLAADHPGLHASALRVNVSAVPASLAAPTGLSATQGSSTANVSLAWSAVPSAVSYELWRGTGNDVASASRLASQLTSRSFSDSSAVPGELYNYWVRAIGSGGLEGEWSAPASGYRAFSAPSNASAVSTPDGVVLTWTGTSGNYMVYRASSASTNEARSIAAVTEATYTYDLSSIFVTNHFWVAQCAPGKLRPGAMAYCGSGCKTLAAPTGFSALGSTESITMSWSAVTGATSYEIWRSTSNVSASAVRIGSTAATSYTDSTATPGIRYYYWAKAVRGGGTSVFSSGANAVRTLVAPTGLVASQGDFWDQVSVSWTNVSGAAQYEIWRGVSSSQSSAELIGTRYSSPYNDTTAISGTRYYYWVRAISSQTGVESPFSASTTGYRPDISSLVVEGASSLTGGGSAFYEVRARCSPDGEARTLPSSAKQTLVYNMTDTSGSAYFGSRYDISDPWGHGYKQWLMVTNAPSSGSKSIRIDVACTWNNATKTGTKTVTIKPKLAGVDLTYLVNASNEVAILDYTGTATAVNVPSSLNGMTVTAICPYAFRYQRSISSLTLPNTLKIIGSSAFFDCQSLTALDIPASVTSIGSEIITGTKIASVTIPASVSTIEVSAFKYAASLATINVDSSNANYTSYAGALFNKDMTKLLAVPAAKTGSFSIPSGVKNISENYQSSFCGSKLTSVSFPASVEATPHMWSIAFSYCHSLSSVSVNSGNETLCASGNVLFSKDMKILQGYPAARSGSTYTIPSSVEKIQSNAFSLATKLTSLSIPASVTNIAQAFSGCTNLVSIYCFGDAPTVPTYSNLYQDYDEWDASMGGYSGYRKVPATVYYLSGTSGWGDKLGGLSTSVWNNPIQSLSIDGSSSVKSGTTSKYRGLGTFQSGHSGIACKVSWDITSGGGYATIDNSGILTTTTVQASQTITIRATATLGGATRTATKTITINP